MKAQANQAPQHQKLQALVPRAAIATRSGTLARVLQFPAAPLTTLLMLKTIRPQARHRLPGTKVASRLPSHVGLIHATVPEVPKTPRPTRSITRTLLKHAEPASRKSLRASTASSTLSLLPLVVRPRTVNSLTIIRTRIYAMTLNAQMSAHALSPFIHVFFLLFLAYLISMCS